MHAIMYSHLYLKKEKYEIIHIKFGILQWNSVHGSSSNEFFYTGPVVCVTSSQEALNLIFLDIRVIYVMLYLLRMPWNLCWKGFINNVKNIN